ncbi:Phenylalanyl-tRNA_synthetase alpha chain [Hexamita inflata]|uniref:phenylalanine--tRNA ligase n=1 Tax=Hexamita inflata TaxID=28002 RepID=A0AA86NQS7_9EUKA|nr:Phenylalanyl-tRNA synthetase alpha chain [Hexamita inflata]
MEQIQEQLYNLINEANETTSIAAAQKFNVPVTSLVAAMKSLETMETIVTELQKQQGVRLTAEGEQAVKSSTPEFQILTFLNGQTLHKSKIIEHFGEAFISANLSAALRRKLVTIVSQSKTDTDPQIVPSQTTVDDIQVQLQNLATQAPAQIAGLKKAKYVEQYEEKYFLIKKGPTFSNGLVKPQPELTQADLTSGKPTNIKALNFNALGKPPVSGSLHPLLKMKTAFVQILSQMGFQQMKTEKYVESSFWNFDSLFQPQQHPARDMHDTFFLQTPALADLSKITPEYLQAVKNMHEKGGFQSHGYNYVWAENEAQKNILRTHTTSVSSRFLYQHAQNVKKSGKFTPLKCFSIDRVFRNETLDATHLCEFHQVEGFICDKNLNLGNLMAVIREFFKALGMPQIRFKPCYNPYTEPSMEIFCFHEGLKRWIEVGNSGIFRPEMLRPMGFDEDVVALAWGLSLERPTMIKYHINNIRDLVGPGCDITMIQSCQDILME